MAKINFEYRIALAYLIIGSVWIIFSDRFLSSIIEDIDILTKVQTYKGWFYVLITAFLFFMFLKKHLNLLRLTQQELSKHRNNLQEMVTEKTLELDIAIKVLKSTNKELFDKNDIINNQNDELKTTLQNLKETQSQLIQAEKMASLGILTAGVAHEINNPLNYIAGGVTGLENYFDEEKIHNKKISLYLNSIKTGVDRASSIISGLNQMNRNKDTYDEICEIHTIINNCLAIINYQLKNRITIIKEFSKDNPVVQGNAGQLHQVFINILVNASQSMLDKGLITISTEKKKGMVYIIIADTGNGITEENLSKITDPFFTTKDPGKGTGLGLSITYNIIQAHKGKINFKSEPDKGTTVTINLPEKL